MAKAANGKAMRNRRRKRYERINPIIEKRIEYTAKILNANIARQNGEEPEEEPPTPQQWQEELRQTPTPVQPYTREQLDADVEKLKAELLPY